MGGGAWPFLVGGAICLVNFVNERDLSLLTSYVEASLHGRLLRGTMAEFLVSASHQLALTTSLPFVHTARRSYRLNDPVKCSDRGDVGGSPSATSREVKLRKDHCRTSETERPENDETSLLVGRFLTVPADSVFWLDRTHSFWISPNPGTKSVKENATKQPAFANPETVFVRKQCCNVKSKTTLGNGYLGSRIDEERSEMRYLSLKASCAPSLLAEGTSAWVSQIVVPPSSRGYGTEADLPCVTARGWPKFELRTSGARSGPKALDDPKSSTRPQVRRIRRMSGDWIASVCRLCARAPNYRPTILLSFFTSIVNKLFAEISVAEILWR
ncbi:hypothetical protein YC2023_004776 [Brassica napus]